jgi:hypothetical protein
MDAYGAVLKISKTPLASGMHRQEVEERRFSYRISKCYLLRVERARDETGNSG